MLSVWKYYLYTHWFVDTFNHQYVGKQHTHTHAHIYQVLKTNCNLKHHIIVAYFGDLSIHEDYCHIAKHGIAKNIKPISPAEPIK